MRNINPELRQQAVLEPVKIVEDVLQRLFIMEYIFFSLTLVLIHMQILKSSAMMKKERTRHAHFWLNCC